MFVDHKTMGCPAHPKYEAVMTPGVPCRDCWRFYALKKLNSAVDDLHKRVSAAEDKIETMHTWIRRQPRSR